MEIHTFNSFLDIFNTLLYTTLSNQEKRPFLSIVFNYG